MHSPVKSLALPRDHGRKVIAQKWFLIMAAFDFTPTRRRSVRRPLPSASCEFQSANERAINFSSTFRIRHSSFDSSKDSNASAKINPWRACSTRSAVVADGNALLGQLFLAWGSGEVLHDVMQRGKLAVARVSRLPRSGDSRYGNLFKALLAPSHFLR